MCGPTEGVVRVRRETLERFCASVFKLCGLSSGDADVSAKVLVAADARGIPSHGVARLERYVNGLRSGLMDPSAKVQVLHETPLSVAMDARGAMGAPVSVRAMTQALSKAEVGGAGFAVVRDSNHFGIAGYYAMMALPKDMIGIAMTNTAALGVPTFGRRVMFGTNPIAFAAPADREGAFVLDMATTVVTRGKVEVYDRAEKSLPPGWAVNTSGTTATDPDSLLDDMLHRRGGGILPLGGEGDDHGGHKGFGLAMMVDILCAVLSGGPSGPHVFDTADSSARVSHFFGAFRVDMFRDPSEFRRDMDAMLSEYRSAQPAEGADRVYFAGLKELEQERQAAENGVPLTEMVYAKLKEIGKELGSGETLVIT